MHHIPIKYQKMLTQCNIPKDLGPCASNDYSNVIKNIRAALSAEMKTYYTNFTGTSGKHPKCTSVNSLTSVLNIYFLCH